MVIATITSGLGNQLFQYALARQLAVSNQTSLFLDTRFYRSDYAKESQRGFKLDNFNIKYKKLSKPLNYFLKLTKLFNDQTFRPFFSLQSEQYYHFNPDVLRAKDGVVITKGYWHSEQYFKGATDLIRRELKFTNTPGPNFAEYKNLINSAVCAVAIHVRRGDYVHHPVFSKTFGFIGLDYYNRATALLMEKHQDCQFFIFTDDQKWVKENLKLPTKPTYIHNTGDQADLDDLHLMSVCDHNIIANSSYSWWGAWLNENKDKSVIAPKNWFRDQPDWNTKDLLPKDWIVI